jgi:citrate lyase subunit beta/citryl-CoA lyase
MRPAMRRSVLYVPGDSEKMLQKSAFFSADTLLLNLEDGVAGSQKEAARKNVANALKSINFGNRETVVRVNSLNTEDGLKDLSCIAPAQPDGICFPKIEKVADIENADSIISDLENRLGLPKGSIKIHMMVESAACVLHLPEIASASPRMASLILGTADYIADVRCQPGEDRQELLLALQTMVLSARAAGIDAIDGPCFDLRNHDLLSREASQARRLGFDGKSALHPNQLDEINRLFDVTPEEIAWAEMAIAELDEAENRGKALTTIEGKLFDNPHRVAAERILRNRKPR